jgi:hypothetical protein
LVGAYHGEPRHRGCAPPRAVSFDTGTLLTDADRYVEDDEDEEEVDDEEDEDFDEEAEGEEGDEEDEENAVQGKLKHPRY